MKVAHIIFVTIISLVATVRVSTSTTSSIDSNDIHLHLIDDVHLNTTKDEAANNKNCSIEDSANYISDAKLEIIKDIVIGFTANEIQKGNFESTWN